MSKTVNLGDVNKMKTVELDTTIKSGTGNTPESEASTMPDVKDTSPKPRAKMADSVFTNLFKIPKYSLQLYQALHPEDKHTTKELIRIVTLENILLN